MSDHFFSRWSRRKQAAAQGLPADEPVQPASHALALPPEGAQTQGNVPATAGASQPANALPEPPGGLGPEQASAKSEAPLPTLQDAQALTPASDFQSFMRQGVPAEVRNAAVKKLFTDPHFNVMDGLDIYIGDYNTPDPMPAGMLKKMVGAQLLGLLDQPHESAAQLEAPAEPVLPAGRDAASLGENPEQSPAAQEVSPVVAQSPPSLPDSAAPVSPVLPPLVNAPPEHDHPDLQLQPNHAPASPSPGPSTG
ncbi:DUF3306 domain-containing protein [Limnohabitans sp. DM1]|uniref:DUF3306 domain-containing protein n=1 Tax=Limnohabitans sp. DM1 TaxID=1597955 RepID=UPI000AAA4745|nr:DUF3306 domain-containing protein [Limnohabitans sp. DM1]